MCPTTFRRVFVTPGLCYTRALLCHRNVAGRFMHILPAGLWSVVAPLQLSPGFRARHRTAHRRLGRLFIFMSASIAFGVVPLIVNGASMFRRSV